MKFIIALFAFFTIETAMGLTLSAIPRPYRPMIKEAIDSNDPTKCKAIAGLEAIQSRCLIEVEYNSELRKKCGTEQSETQKLKPCTQSFFEKYSKKLNVKGFRHTPMKYYDNPDRFCKIDFDEDGVLDFVSANKHPLKGWHAVFLELSSPKFANKNQGLVTRKRIRTIKCSFDKKTKLGEIELVIIAEKPILFKYQNGTVEKVSKSSPL